MGVEQPAGTSPPGLLLVGWHGVLLPQWPLLTSVRSKEQQPPPLTVLPGTSGDPGVVKRPTGLPPSPAGPGQGDIFLLSELGL